MIYCRYFLKERIMIEKDSEESPQYFWNENYYQSDMKNFV